MAAKKKPAAKSPAPKRTDAAGRSGMGESAKSNVTSKSKGGVSSAAKTGVGAFKKTMKATGSSSKAADAMYGSMENASKYAASKKKK
jgi:hypothetical protein